jgi:L-amino acid ligase C-terminal domain 2
VLNLVVTATALALTINSTQCSVSILLQQYFSQYTKTGPCLVEVGSRCHGGEGTWQHIANECVGYNQIDSTLDAYVQPDKWDALPLQPVELLKEGREVFLVAHANGRVLSVPGVDVIRRMPSFRGLEMTAQAGSVLRQTVDCFTRPGAVQLAHADAAVLQADYDAIRQLEKQGLFELSQEEARDSFTLPPLQRRTSSFGTSGNTMSSQPVLM